jgi:hypothetical protein
MKTLKRTSIITLLISFSLFTQACGGSFAGQLRVILAASGPLISSLPLSPSIKSGLIVDFSDLANGAATLKQDIDACPDKSCKLNAVEKFEGLFETVESRGHFGSHQRLQQVESILRAIIQSAKIYYGGSSGAGVKRGAQVPESAATEQTLKARIDELKKAMEP